MEIVQMVNYAGFRAPFHTKWGFIFQHKFIFVWLQLSSIYGHAQVCMMDCSLLYHIGVITRINKAHPVETLVGLFDIFMLLESLSPFPRLLLFLLDFNLTSAIHVFLLAYAACVLYGRFPDLLGLQCCPEEVSTLLVCICSTECFLQCEFCLLPQQIRVALCLLHGIQQDPL
jgi:hypothetical protein